ncbi:MAG: ABC transporter ATP-binding protein [Candidatus Methanomethylophilaceae archaeon]
MKLELQDIHQGYGERIVINGINVTFETGKIIVLLGPNGCGKSTLIKTIAGIMKPRNGKVNLDDVDVLEMDPSERAKRIGYVPQNFVYMPYTTVLETVLVGRTPYMGWEPSDEDLSAVERSMRMMDIDDLMYENVNELSGGQRQRVFIARSLTQDTDFYLFDEPTNALDLKYQLDTMDLMRRLVTEKGIGVIMAVHDLNIAIRYADDVIILKDEHIVLHGPPREVITTESIADVYGVNAEIVENRNGLYVLASNSINQRQ